MTEDISGPVPRRRVTPRQLPLREKADLFERLRRARQQQPPSSWQQLEIEEGYAQRMLEHFYGSALRLEEHADRRPQAEIAAERDGRIINARLTAMPPNRRWSWEPEESGEGQGETVDPRARFRPRVPRDFVPPPLRREITPSQLPLREQADLFAQLQIARKLGRAQSWRYLEVEKGFAQRTLEHLYRSAMKLEKNADKRPFAKILAECIDRYYRARSTAASGRQSPGRDPGEVGAEDGSPAQPRQMKTAAARRARKARSVAETYREELCRTMNGMPPKHATASGSSNARRHSSSLPERSDEKQKSNVAWKSRKSSAGRPRKSCCATEIASGILFLGSPTR
jgi:hypothetical protein